MYFKWNESGFVWRLPIGFCVYVLQFIYILSPDLFAPAPSKYRKKAEMNVKKWSVLNNPTEILSNLHASAL